MKSDAIIGAVQFVTKRWAKQRKAEERHKGAIGHRRDVMCHRRDRYSLKAAAKDQIPAAYLKASTNGTLPATARQIMYAARGPMQDATGEMLDDKYFTQTLLPTYLRDHSQETADWDVVFDARGHFTEPHTDLIVPLGTLNVRDYLSPRDEADGPLALPKLFPTIGPANRFGAILFLEKEGFMPLLSHVKLAERFDIAVMSTKGMSVIASRVLVDRLCGVHDIPLLVLHDFDKAGFSILQGFRSDNDRYTYEHGINVVDLGIRLEDVQENQLQSERVAIDKSTSSKFRANLRNNGATSEEIDYLLKGQRVELNAFASDELVKWIEGKLVQHKIGKVIPDESTLTEAYRSELRRWHLDQRLQEINEEAERIAAAATIPKSLAKQIKAAFKDDPSRPWDEIVGKIVADAAAHYDRSSPKSNRSNH